MAAKSKSGKSLFMSIILHAPPQGRVTLVKREQPLDELSQSLVTVNIQIFQDLTISNYHTQQD